MVLHHIQLLVSSLSEAKKFYLTALAPLGFEEYYAIDGLVGLSGPNGVPDLWLKGPSDSPTKGLHAAFAAESRDVVDRFYEAALKAGAKDNGAPGLRAYTPTYYAAYVFDADGNNIEVLCDVQQKK